MATLPGNGSFGFSVNDNTKLTSPGFGRAVMPTSRVGSYINQQLSSFSAGQAQRPQSANIDAQDSLLNRQPSTVGFGNIGQSGQRVAADIERSNGRVRQNLQIAQQRRIALQRQQQAQQGARAVPKAGGGVSAQPGPQAPVTKGPTVNRIQGILRNFGGLKITEVGGNRDYDVAHGVARVPTSYHYDRQNPAVDIAGSTAQLDALYKELVRQGGWRQILWRVPGHYDHLHVA